MDGQNACDVTTFGHVLQPDWAVQANAETPACGQTPVGELKTNRLVCECMDTATQMAQT